MAEYSRDELMALATQIANSSDGRLRLAHNEEDATTIAAMDAAHFLKLDEQRLGRDIELYGFMGDRMMGWQETLATFLEEVVLPLKSSVPNAYQAASDGLKKAGLKVYPAELQQAWQELLA